MDDSLASSDSSPAALRMGDHVRVAGWRFFVWIFGVVVGLCGSIGLLRADDTQTDRATRCDRDFLRPVMISGNRVGVEESLADAQRAADEGDWATMFTITQIWLDRMPGAQVFDARQSGVRSLWSIARDLRSRAPAAARERYRDTIRVAVTTLEQNARENRDPALFRELIRRYGDQTEAAAALDLLAGLAADRGELVNAILLRERMRIDPVLRTRFTPNMRLKLAIDLRTLGEFERAERLSRGFEQTPIRLLGEDRTFAEWLDLIVPEVDSPESPTRLASTTGTVAGSVPGWNPVWRARAGKEDGKLADLFREWRDEQTETGRLPATTLGAVRVGEQILVNRFGRIVSHDARTGKVLWEWEIPARQPDRWRASITTPKDPVVRNRFGPRPVNRGHDPLRDLESFLIGNDLWSAIDSHAKQIFVVEPASILASNLLRSPQGFLFSPVPERFQGALLCLRIGGTDAPTEPVWRLGGIDPEPVGLIGHRIVGAPHVHNGILFVVSEKLDRPQRPNDSPYRPAPGRFAPQPAVPASDNAELFLSAVRPGTGEVIWSEAVAVPFLSTSRSLARVTRAARVTVIADGQGEVLVCDSGFGVIIGVDPFTGETLWMTPGVDACETEGQSEEIADFTFGTSGFVRQPRGSKGVVVHMPRYSSAITAWDARTGERRWRVDRRNPSRSMSRDSETVTTGDEYLAAVTDRFVVLVGRGPESGYVRALDLNTGESRWTVSTGRPAGVGCRIESIYLLPTVTGHIARIDLDAGRLDEGYDLASRLAIDSVFRRDVSANLRAMGDQLVSVGLTEITTFPLGDNPFDSGEDRDRRERLANLAPTEFDADRFDDLLRFTLEDLAASRIELLATRIDRLDEIVAASELSPSLSDRRVLGELRLRAGLRELETLPLAKLIERHDHIVDRLPFGIDGRALTRIAIERFAEAGRVVEVLHLLDRFPPETGLLAMTDRRDDPLLSLSNRVRIAGLIEQAISRSQDDPEPILAARERDVLGQFDPSDAKSRDRLARHLRFFPDRPGSAFLRHRLAESLWNAGRLQQAELLWLVNRSDERPAIRRAATLGLFRIRDRAGLGVEAARLWETLGKTIDFDTAGLPEQELIRPRLDALDPATRLAIRQRDTSKVGLPVRMRVEPRPENILDYRRQIVNHSTPVETPDGLQFRLRQHRSFLNGSMFGKLTVIDGQSNSHIGTIDPISGERFQLDIDERTFAGHCTIDGGRNRIGAISLLELPDGEPFWSHMLFPVDAEPREIRAAYATPRFGIFVSDGQIICADTATGEPLWIRNGFDSDLGPENVAGDDTAIVIRERSSRTITLLDTTDGTMIRRDSDRPASEFYATVYERLMVTEERDSGTRRLVIRDLFTREELLSRPLSFQTRSHTVDRWVILWDGSGEVSGLLFDLKRRKILSTFQLPPGVSKVRTVNSFRVSADDERIYVTLILRDEIRRPMRSLTVPYPTFDAVGLLFAFDRESGEQLWHSESSGSRSLLRLPGFDLPGLPVLSGDGWYDGPTTNWSLDLLDPETGRSLGSWPIEKPSDLYAVEYDPQQRRLTLRRADRDLILEFSRPASVPVR